jgi:hypothetical protein
VSAVTNHPSPSRAGRPLSSPIMKLNISLTLAALSSSACSAFALSPHHAISSLSKTAQAAPAFVHQPNIKSRDVSISASGTSNEAITTRGGGDLPIDIPLLTYFGLWYLGNFLVRSFSFLCAFSIKIHVGDTFSISYRQLLLQCVQQVGTQSCWGCYWFSANN